MKPSKYRSSVESLVRSALAQSVRTVNPLVDLYNAVSLAHVFPYGGEPFTPLGTTEEQPVQAK